MELEQEIYTLCELKDMLNEKQKKFCHYYVIDWNTTQSYKKAYMIEDDNSAGASGHKLLRNTKIKQYIELIKNDYEILCGISKTKQLNEYYKIAYSNIAHLHNTWIELKEFKTLTDEQRECIESIESKTETKPQYNSDLGKKEEIEVKHVKIKLYSKLTALERIDKLMGYNEAEKHDLSSKDGTMTQQVVGITFDKE